jgi:cytochrome bd-type quinol oxidase subunit 2
MLRQPFAWIGVACVLGGLLAVFTGLRSCREKRAVGGSCAFLAGLMVAGAASVFPIMLHSTLAPEDSLTAYGGAATGHGLAIALVWWPFALALSIGYFLFIHHHYEGKAKPAEDSQSPY